MREKKLEESSGGEQARDETEARASTTHASPFDHLLALLAPERDRAGEEYELLRRRLITFFRSRRSLTPEDHADRVLERVAKKLGGDDQLEIRDPIGYAIGTARMIWLEIGRSQEQERHALAELGRTDVAEVDEPLDENLLECFDKCFNELPSENAELIIDYYRDEAGDKIAHRKEMAARLAIPVSALRLRAHRLRARLQECIRRCAGARVPQVADETKQRFAPPQNEGEL